MEQKALNDTNVNYLTDSNRDRQSTDEPTLAGTLTAVCENLGQTLQLLANQVEKLNDLQTDNIIDDDDELWDKLRPKVENLIKEIVNEAEVDIDAYVEINSASLRV